MHHLCCKEGGGLELELKVELEGQAKRSKLESGRGRRVFLLGTVKDNSQSSSQPNPNSHDIDER
jgi:hypothetical protein